MMSEDVQRDERMENLFSNLESANEEPPVLLVSSMNKEKEEEKKSKKEKKEKKGSKYSIFDDYDNWDDIVTNIPKLHLRKKVKATIFDDVENGKKKGKKKEKKGDRTDFKKEFDPEMGALKCLLLSQNEFVGQLQNEFNQMNKQKSSARGIGKFTNELVSNINTARKVSADLIKQISDIKKTVADLSMKERKELGALVDGDGNISDNAAALLKQLITGDRKAFMGDGAATVEDLTDDEYMATAISDAMNELGDAENHQEEESQKYLRYEGRGVKVKVILNDDGTHTFFAEDQEGNIVDDYPLPSNSTALSINRSTMIAKDDYGVAYQIVE